MSTSSPNLNLPENGAVTISISGEVESPNVTSTPSSENVEVNIQELEDIQAENEEEQPALVDEHSYANDLAARIIEGARVSSLRIVGVAGEDFSKMHDAGLIERGMYLKDSGIVVVIHANADTTNTYWDKSND